MSKLPLFPEIEEYIKECRWKEENYPKSKDMKKYDQLELEFINELYHEKFNREPTEQEIGEEKIELMKMKYLMEKWMDEYFEKVEKEQESNESSTK